jgi:hypothetical protein
MPVVPLDFGPAYADEDWQRTGQMLVRLVEYLDRAGAMGPAIERVIAWKPKTRCSRRSRTATRAGTGASRALMAGLVGERRRAWLIRGPNTQFQIEHRVPEICSEITACCCFPAGSAAAG